LIVSKQSELKTVNSFKKSLDKKLSARSRSPKLTWSTSTMKMVNS